MNSVVRIQMAVVKVQEQLASVLCRQQDVYMNYEPVAIEHLWLSFSPEFPIIRDREASTHRVISSVDPRSSQSQKDTADLLVILVVSPFHCTACWPVDGAKAKTNADCDTRIYCNEYVKLSSSFGNYKEPLVPFSSGRLLKGVDPFHTARSLSPAGPLIHP